MSQEIKEIIKKHWHVLTSDHVCEKLFAQPPLFCHYRPRNIRDFLVRADTYTPPSASGRLTETTGFFPCRACTACRDSCKCTNTFSSHVTGKKYDIRQLSTCSSSNVVYLISCPCGLQYVGKTTRQIRTRIIEHKSAIRRIDEKSPIARHFRDANHPISSLTFVLSSGSKLHAGGMERLLLQAECRWIFHLQTLHPKGLNEEMLLNCFI